MVLTPETLPCLWLNPAPSSLLLCVLGMFGSDWVPAVCLPWVLTGSPHHSLSPTPYSGRLLSSSDIEESLIAWT